MKKPSPDRIRNAVPLSELRMAVGHELEFCNVCGLAAGELGVWVEHDERDVPREPTVWVFIGKDHPDCLRRMERHPRLYAESMGLPGAFPRLCGPCRLRRGFECRHPDTKANGGPGLRVFAEARLRGAILCGRGGRIRLVTPAVRCDGRVTTFPGGA